MNAQQIPFKLYSRLINNRSKIFISLQDLHIAIDEGMPLSTTLKSTLPELGFMPNQDYIEVTTNKPEHPAISFLITFETALIYLNTFKTTEKIKQCIKSLVMLISAKSSDIAQHLKTQEIAKQTYIVQTQAFFNTYFNYDRHFLLTEDDLMALNRMKDACSTLELLLLEINSTKSFSYENISNLLSHCIKPLFNVLKNIKEVGDEVGKIQALVSN